MNAMRGSPVVADEFEDELRTGIAAKNVCMRMSSEYLTLLVFGRDSKVSSRRVEGIVAGEFIPRVIFKSSSRDLMSPLVDYM